MGKVKIKYSLLFLIPISFFLFGQTTIEKINVIHHESNLFLSVKTKIDNTKTIRQAVKNGITLHFQYKIILKEDNWYTFFDFTEINKYYYLSYNNISNDYILINPVTYEKIIDKQFNKIIEHLENLEDFPLINYNLIKNKNLIGEVKFILNPDTLPTFLRLETIWADNWNIDSDWKEWEIK